MRLPKLSDRGSRPLVHRRWQDWAWSQSGSWQDSRLGKALRYGIESGLGVLIILLVVSFWWPRVRTAAPTDVPRAGRATVVHPGDEANTLAAEHLFGQAAPVASAAVPTTPITVDGIVYASTPADSQAVLTLNGKTNVYKAGDALPDGEILAVIDSSDVQLETSGARRRIALAHYGDTSSEGPAAYAAMLRGIGFSNAVDGRDTEAEGITNVATMEGIPENPSLAISRGSARTVYTPPAPAMHIVQLSHRASPREQLRALRAQLIRPH